MWKSKAQSNPWVMETLKSLTKALKDPTHAHQINADFCIITPSTISLVHGWLKLDTNCAVWHLSEGKDLVEWLSNTEKAKTHNWSMATCFHIKWKEHQWHTRTDCFQFRGKRALRWGDIRLLRRLRWLRRLCYHCLLLRSATRGGLLGWELR